ncbi:MAG: tRNA (adenosine(37)-N6)-threonylcarbamoyltransferase complex ATPase subunit type 1 TsaE [Lachnospiraceae bacterium]|nr:tRNA (adenosine(37)-N6)-threonylcarbamoyltransferase complex ATPase subunit type 1 TsaE [Lachnospiraceae bacterium]
MNTYYELKEVLRRADLNLNHRDSNPKTPEFESASPEETFAFARALGEIAVPGQIICLEGDLGAGKTVFAKGLAVGLGVTESVVSPTFTILQVYESGRLPLYHFDAYRIGSPDEMDEIGWEEYAYGGGVTVVEWPSMIEELIPAEALTVRIERDPGKGYDARRILLEA